LENVNDTLPEPIPFQPAIKGKIGGFHPKERALFELTSAWIDLGVQVYIESTSDITGPVPEDPRPQLLSQYLGIPAGLSLDCLISFNRCPPEYGGAKRTIWIPVQEETGSNLPAQMEIWDNSTLPAGINPLRFHPGVAPFPLPVPGGSLIFLYHGALDGGVYQKLIEVCRPHLEQKQFYLVVNDFGYEPDAVACEPKPVIFCKGVIRVHGISNERQLSGLYAAANCLIDPRPYDTAEKYQALGCGIPVLTPVPIKIGDREWSPPCLFSPKGQEDSLRQVLAEYETWLISVAQGCNLVQREMNWHAVAARVLRANGDFGS
jgi:hypothetical protein